MLLGHPFGNGIINEASADTISQNPTSPESAQLNHVAMIKRQDSDEKHDSGLASPRDRSSTANSEIFKRMNSAMFGNKINMVNFQENQMRVDYCKQGVNENHLGSPSRVVGAKRAIRGNGGNPPLRPAEICEITPPKQQQLQQSPQHQLQLSDHLKTILALQCQDGQFGSLIAPLPMAASASNASMQTTAAYQWHPFHLYQNPELASYLNTLATWAPLSAAGSATSIHQTPPQAVRTGTSPPDRCPSTGSSSSGLSMTQLTDLLAQLNASDNGSPSYATIASTKTTTSQQPQSNGQDQNQQPSVSSSIYQMRHGHRQNPTPPTISLPGQNGHSSSISPPNTNEYAALLMAAANYLNSGNGPANACASGGGMSPPTDPRYQSPQLGDSDSETQDPQFSIERAARFYRKAASLCDPTCTWSGQLPSMIARTGQGQSFSCKVFVGGVPWDITEAALVTAFSPFGPVHVEWPGKEARFARSPVKPSAKGKGYVYMIFEHDKSVKSLLENCGRAPGGEYYFELRTRRLRVIETRQVQIIPWNVADSNYIRFPSQHLDPKKTVFVGALHGMITAEVLCNVMNDLFGNVIYAGIDTDKYKYPIGSGRVTFSNSRSYHKAIAAAFVEVKSAKFAKKVQIDPYLEDAPCSNCFIVPGPYFCREFMCFRYFCKTCWHHQHALDIMQSHKPLMRNQRRSQQPQVTMFPINNGGP